MKNIKSNNEILFLFLKLDMVPGNSTLVGFTYIIFKIKKVSG